MELVVVDEPGGFVEAVGEGFKVFGDHADFLGGCLVAVGQMASVREIEAHNAVVGLQYSRISVQIGR